jgi:hypothetical protein
MKRKAKRSVQPPSKSQHVSLKINGQNLDGFGASMPPDRFVVHIYFNQKGLAEYTNDFLAEHELLQWKTRTGKPIRNWKVCAADWIFDHRQRMKRISRLSVFYSEFI